MAFDHLITKYSLQDDYSPKAARVVAATGRVAAASKGADDGIASMGRSLGHAATGIMSLVRGLTFAVGAIGALVAAGGFAANALMQQAADFDALAVSLKVVEGSAQAAKLEMVDLRRIAKGPGLGFKEAIQGYIGFRRGGLSEKFSERLLEELGNQVALSGGGRDMFGRVAYAASELSRQQFLQGDELRQFTEAGLPAHKIVSDAFGTSDTEDLKKQGITAKMVLAALVTEMAKAERAAGSARNTFDNLGDALMVAEAAGGRALNEAFLPVIGAFSEAIETLTDAGVVTAVFQSLASSLDVLELASVDAKSTVLSLGAAMMTAGDGMGVLFAGLKAFLNIIGGIGDMLIPDWMGQGDKYLSERYEVNRRTLTMMDEAFQMRIKADAKKPKPEEKPEDPAEKRQEKILEKIAYNTEPLRIDYSRQTLGGGDIGRLGVTAVEMGGVLGRSRGNEVRVKIDGDGPIAAQVMSVLNQMQRQGIVFQRS